MKQYWVYMMTNRNKTVIYTGITNDLKRRVQEHKDKKGGSFTKRYNINMLVYYESFGSIYDAIAAEKKNQSRLQGQKDCINRKSQSILERFILLEDCFTAFAMTY